MSGRGKASDPVDATICGRLYADDIRATFEALKSERHYIEFSSKCCDGPWQARMMKNGYTVMLVCAVCRREHLTITVAERIDTKRRRREDGERRDWPAIQVYEEGGG